VLGFVLQDFTNWAEEFDFSFFQPEGFVAELFDGRVIVGREDQDDKVSKQLIFKTFLSIMSI
jgi:hypothetical protein